MSEQSFNSNDEKKWQTPESFRVSTDAADTSAFNRLERADQQQQAWREQFSVPMSDSTPKTRERANAVILIATLSDLNQLTNIQTEQLAEAYAAIGEYQLAAETTLDDAKYALYEAIREAVYLDDEDWCEHPDKHKYIKEYVYSLRESAELPMLACNICRKWNVTDILPTQIVAQQKTRQAVRLATQGMDMTEVKRYLQANIR